MNDSIFNSNRRDVTHFVDIDAYLAQPAQARLPLLDVRAPREYQKGHVPGAHSVPLFSDEERATVGTLYKQKSKESAFLKGLDLVGPKMSDFVRTAQRLAPNKQLAVHCWRGGMRSQSLAWLWSQAGFEVHVIRGGYKAYRKLVHQQLATPLALVIVSGKTGSGKTDLLHQLARQGEQIIDLEGLARHKGSAFGGLGPDEQPSTEQFENELHRVVVSLDPQRRVWVEDESQAIGGALIPSPFWEQMKEAPTFVIDLPLEVRVQRLVTDYAGFDDAGLAHSLDRIQKRLGGQAYQQAKQALAAKNYARVAALALKYYDRAYMRSLERRPSHQVTHLSFEAFELQRIATALCQAHERALTS